MNSDLAQLVILAAYGNVYLAGEGGAPPELTESHTGFKYSRVNFVRYPKPYADGIWNTLVIKNTADWYSQLRELGARNIWLVRRGDPVPQDIARHELVAFAGGGDWHLQVDYLDKSEGWSAGWEFVDTRGDRQGAYWNVTYSRVLIEGMPPVEKHDLREMEARLRRALVEVERFARANDEEGWADVFKRELNRLDATGNTQKSDMLPEEGYSREAHRLVSAASGSWVFGGMGSWNDISFSDEQVRADYGRVSAELYDAVVTSAVAATNSFERPV
ncbi:MAG: hypothetical protein M3437_18725 [Chloroflexota bacterium]|nr:hypothetical protein [Chloroflexota bacterium]MDQ5867809.1 hypothetical protein [Chloroflexota bacterium]